jgi:ATP-dependent DNA helicase RecQ
VAFESVLQDVFGKSSWRPGQEDLVRADVGGRDILAVMPTGSGKSLCFQMPAVLCDGLTVVITPLISLMRDQVEHVNRGMVEAEFLSHVQDTSERYKVMSRVVRGEVTLLYVAPERLLTKDFLASTAGLKVRRVVVDEAHCMDQMVEFRPSYLEIADAISRWSCPVSAFTATATPRTRKIIETRLKMQNPFIYSCSFDRPNLFYAVAKKPQREVDLILDIMGREKGAGIVYRCSRYQVEDTWRRLAQDGINAVPYHAGLSTDAREFHQSMFMDGRARVVVATIAFGMGIDKADIRWVIHGEPSQSAEAYLQESGRAGRDGEPANCVMLYDPGDIAVIRSFADKAQDEEVRTAMYNGVVNMKRYAETTRCRRATLLKYMGEDRPGPCGACDNCRRAGT